MRRVRSIGTQEPGNETSAASASSTSTGPRAPEASDDRRHRHAVVTTGTSTTAIEPATRHDQIVAFGARMPAEIEDALRDRGQPVGFLHLQLAGAQEP